MIVVDVETTGLDERKHSIVSIGAVEFENPRNQFSVNCCIWEGAEVSKEALEINGFTEEQVRDATNISLETAVGYFIGWAKKCGEWTLAGENPGFDSKFLNAALSKYNLKAGADKLSWPFGYRTVDVHTLCYASYLRRGITPPVAKSRSAISLDDALAYVGLQPEPKPHKALTGAILEAEVLHRLLYGKPLFDEFRNKLVPGYRL